MKLKTKEEIITEVIDKALEDGNTQEVNGELLFNEDCIKNALSIYEEAFLKEKAFREKELTQEFLKMIIKAREKLPYVLCYGLKVDLKESEIKDFETMFISIYEEELKSELEKK